MEMATSLSSDPISSHGKKKKSKKSKHRHSDLEVNQELTEPYSTDDQSLFLNPDDSSKISKKAKKKKREQSEIVVESVDSISLSKFLEMSSLTGEDNPKKPKKRKKHDEEIEINKSPIKKRKNNKKITEPGFSPEDQDPVHLVHEKPTSSFELPIPKEIPPIFSHKKKHKRKHQDVLSVGKESSGKKNSADNSPLLDESIFAELNMSETFEGIEEGALSSDHKKKKHKKDHHTNEEENLSGKSGKKQSNVSLSGVYNEPKKVIKGATENKAFITSTERKKKKHKKKHNSDEEDLTLNSEEKDQEPNRKSIPISSEYTEPKQTIEEGTVSHEKKKKHKKGKKTTAKKLDIYELEDEARGTHKEIYMEQQPIIPEKKLKKKKLYKGDEDESKFTYNESIRELSFQESALHDFVDSEEVVREDNPVLSKPKKKKHKKEKKTTSEKLDIDEVEDEAKGKNDEIFIEQKQAIPEKKLKKKKLFKGDDESKFVTHNESITESRFQESALHDFVESEEVVQEDNPVLSKPKKKKKKHKEAEDVQAKMPPKESINLEPNFGNLQSNKDISNSNIQPGEVKAHKKEKKKRDEISPKSKLETITRPKASFSYSIFNDEIEEPVEFEIPLLHKNGTIRYPTKSQIDEFHKAEIKIKNGRYTKLEKEMILKNWAEFVQRFGADDPSLMLGIKRDPVMQKNILKFIKLKHFYLRLAKGLNDRTLCSVYKQARSLLDPDRNGAKLTPEEVEEVKRLQTIHGNKWNVISEIIGKPASQCSGVVHNKHLEHCRTGHWTQEESEKLKAAVNKVFGKNIHDISRKKHHISWKKISKEVATRDALQCRFRWMESMGWTKEVDNRVKWGKKSEAHLIYLLYRNLVDDEALIDWEALFPRFQKFVPSYFALTKKWHSIKGKRVPHHLWTSHKDSVDYLFKTRLAKLMDRLNISINDLVSLSPDD